MKRGPPEESPTRRGVPGQDFDPAGHPGESDNLIGGIEIRPRFAIDRDAGEFESSGRPQAKQYFGRGASRGEIEGDADGPVLEVRHQRVAGRAEVGRGVANADTNAPRSSCIASVKVKALLSASA